MKPRQLWELSRQQSCSVYHPIQVKRGLAGAQLQTLSTLELHLSIRMTLALSELSMWLLHCHMRPRNKLSTAHAIYRQPITTGTSVLGIKYSQGVLLAADTLASYGSLAKYDNISRLHKIGQHICMGAGGDLSDFQYLQHVVDAKMLVSRPLLTSRLC